MRSPFIPTLVAAVAVGLIAQAAGLPFPIVAVLAVAAGLAVDTVVRRRQQR